METIKLVKQNYEYMFTKGLLIKTAFTILYAKNLLNIIKRL